MPWVKIADDLDENEDWLAVSDAALGAWLRMMTRAARNLTDGFIPAVIAKRTRPSLVKELCARGRLEHVADGYQLRGFLKYNPSAADVLARREHEKSRVANLRKVGAQSSRKIGDAEWLVINDSADVADCVRPYTERTPLQRTAGVRTNVRALYGSPGPGPDLIGSGSLDRSVCSGSLAGAEADRPHTRSDGSGETPEPEAAATVPPPPPSPPSRRPLSPESAAIAAEIARHESLAGIDAAVLAEAVNGARMARGAPVAWVVAAVADAAASLAVDAAAGSTATLRDRAQRVRAFANRARRPDAVELEPAPAALTTGGLPVDDVPPDPDEPHDLEVQRAGLAAMQAALRGIGGTPATPRRENASTVAL